MRTSGDAIGKDGEEESMMMPGFIPKQAFHEELKLVVHQMDAWALEFIDGLEKSESTALLLKGTGEDAHYLPCWFALHLVTI